jgi:exodeoxyribonuclease VII small subunit
MKEKKGQPPDFETALERLETITGKLESGELKLEEAVNLYKEGIDLLAYCHGQLSAAEKQITILKEKNRKLIETDFNPEEVDDD